MDPDDDPILIHAEMIDADEGHDVDLDGDGVGDSVLAENVFVFHMRNFINKVFPPESVFPCFFLFFFFYFLCPKAVLSLDVLPMEHVRE